MIETFITFSQQAEPFADFRLAYDQPEALQEIVGSSRVKSFTSIGCHSSQSIIALWHSVDKKSLEHQPVVWLDSEGSPSCTFAQDFGLFLQLLPYDFGLLYDILSTYSFLQETPSRYDEFATRYNSVYCEQQLTKARSKYKGHAAYCEWLIKYKPILAGNEVYAAVIDSARKFPGLEKWLYP